MAYEAPGSILSFEGNSTSLAQFRLVAPTTVDNRVGVPSTGARVLGVMTNDYDSTELGKAVTVQVQGVTKVEAASGNLSVGELVTPDSSGRADVASTANSDDIAGIVVLGSSGSTSRIVSMLLTYGGSA